MNERTTFSRKIAYVVAMAVLLYPLSLLSSPRTVDDQGGVLAQLRSEHQLGEADLGEIDPASETMKLATVGLRGVAVNLLWTKANEYKKTEDWSRLTATLDQLAKLQPHFITFWKFQSWNQSYNLSVEFDDYRDRYYYVRRGIEFLEEGQKYNRDNPQILWELGWFIGQKIGRSDDKIQYRRLFKADDEYHGGRPVDRRDNWLVGKEWYLESVVAADEKGRGIGRKSPLVFYTGAPKSQMSYSEAIEEEGQFEKAAAGWRDSEEEWRAFGAQEIEHSTGVILHLNSEDQLAEAAAEVEQELQAMADDLRERLLEERRAALSDKEREAVDTPPEERDPDQANLAYQAERKLEIKPRDLAESLGSENPELRRAALRKAAEFETLDRELRYTRNYKQTSNYDYWLVRSIFEQTEDALQARQLLYAGKKAFREDADPETAKGYYEQGLARWRAVLDEFPELLDVDGTTGDDVLVYIIEYNRVLGQLEEDIPDDFPLWDIIENFDPEQKLIDQLRAYKERTGQLDGSAPEQPPAADESPAEEVAAEGAPAEDSAEDADEDSVEAAGDEADEEEPTSEPKSSKTTPDSDSDTAAESDEQ